MECNYYSYPSIIFYKLNSTTKHNLWFINKTVLFVCTTGKATQQTFIYKDLKMSAAAVVLVCFLAILTSHAGGIWKYYVLVSL